MKKQGVKSDIQGLKEMSLERFEYEDSQDSTVDQFDRDFKISKNLLSKEKATHKFWMDAMRTLVMQIAERTMIDADRTRKTRME